MECLYPPKFTGWNPNFVRGCQEAGPLSGGCVRRAKPAWQDRRPIRTPRGRSDRPSATWGRRPVETQPRRRQDPGFRSLGGHEKQTGVAYGTLSLWPFVRATWAKIGRQHLSQKIKILFSFYEWEPNGIKSDPTWFILNITYYYIVHIYFS